MQSTDIIDAVNTALRSTRIRQAELAAFCRVTQGHVSKVLTRQTSLSNRMKADLADWLLGIEAPAASAGSELDRAIERLLDAPEEKRMHILHILSSLSELI
jgi:hypothetical protein